MTRTFALVVGLIFLVGGILGFIPGVVQPPPTSDANLSIQLGYGYLFGIFPVNIVIDVLYIIIGAAGLLSYNNAHTSRNYAQVVAVLFGILALMGIPAGINTVFGLAPVFGNSVWLHAVVAVIAALVGWMTHEEEATPIRTS